MARRLLLGLVLLSVCGCALGGDDVWRNIILPEQRSIDYRDPAQLPSAPIPPSVPPRTVSDPRPETTEWQLSLDDAIRIALENAQVVRTLAGVTAVSSGQTIYDAAITSTTIDQAQATFDPTVKWNNTWSRTNTPTGAFVTGAGVPGITGPAGATGIATPGTPAGSLESFITSTPADAYSSDVGLTKTNVLGGKWSLDWTENPTRLAADGLPAQPPEPQRRNPQLHPAPPPRSGVSGQHGSDRDRPAEYRAVVLRVQG